MLSYETCCKLKDAGFPQKNTVRVHWYQPSSDRWYLDLRNRAMMMSVEPFTSPEMLACPNGDELLAALQAKYPDASFRLGVHPKGTDARAEVSRGPFDNPVWLADATEDTPAEALAQLWLALAAAAQTTPQEQGR